mgnify:FL=1
MSFQVGDKVKFLNEKLEGEVKEVLVANHLVVTCSDGFDHHIAANEVLKVTEDDEVTFHKDEVHIKDQVKQVKLHKPNMNSFLGRYMSTTKYQFEKVVEVDLHLEELVEFPGRLDDWQKLHTQMQHVKKCLSAARNENVRRMVFIHGVGTGVLRSELWNLLSDYDDLSFQDADHREYGKGATIVFFK